MECHDMMTGLIKNIINDGCVNCKLSYEYE